MDANPFSTSRRYLFGTPFSTWGALLASVIAAVLFVLTLPIMYLFIDLLTWRGAVPSYAGLTPQRQQAFQNEWIVLGAQEETIDTLNLIRPISLETYVTDATRWEWRWQATNYNFFRSQVSQEAANLYLELTPEGNGDASRTNVVVPTGKRLGVLSLVARERPHWTSRLLAKTAYLFPWTWQPDSETGLNSPYLLGLFAITLLMMCVQCGFVFAAEHLAADATLNAVGRMRRTVFNHANRLGLLAVRPQAAAEAADLFTKKIDAVQEGLRVWLLYGWRAPLMAILLIAVLLLSNPLLTVAFLLLGAVIWLFGGQFAAWFRRDTRQAARRSEARLSQLRESITILHLVKSYLMERFNQTRVERQLTDQTRAEWRRLRGESLSRPALIVFVLFASLAMLYVAGRSVLVGEMSVAGLMFKIAAIVGLFWAVSIWITTQVKVSRATGASASVLEFLDRRADPGQPIDAEFLQPMTRKIELVEVSLRESGTGRMLLENVSVTLPRGTRLAVIGSDLDEVESFAHVLTRFVDPTGGEVRFDGKNTRWVTHESLRTQVAMISRRNLIFSDTVANNIGCGDAGFSLPQIIEAAKVAHAHAFVQRLPYGYETMIGDSGYSLKSGEQLRIAIARAVLRDPSVIIVEEPDAALDDDSRALLDDTFNRIRTGRTLVLLTRRQALLQQAEKVLVLHRGRVAAAGTHDELLRSNTLYRQLLFEEIPALTESAV